MFAGAFVTLCISLSRQLSSFGMSVSSRVGVSCSTCNDAEIVFNHWQSTCKTRKGAYQLLVAEVDIDFYSRGSIQWVLQKCYLRHHLSGGNVRLSMTLEGLWLTYSWRGFFWYLPFAAHFEFSKGHKKDIGKFALCSRAEAFFIMHPTIFN